MVHRIQNRNPGYSDFGNNTPNASFTFSNNSSSPVSHGANALKLENEVVSENFNESVNEVNNQYHEELLKNQDVESVNESISENNDFEFNQDNSIEFEQEYRSPGWDRYKKNKLLKWKK